MTRDCKFLESFGSRPFSSLLAGMLICTAAACGRTSLSERVSTVEPEAACGNLRDDDLDGLTDCLDSDCLLSAECVVGGENCGNQEDDDGDTLVDCLDPECRTHRICQSPSGEVCDNKLDDDQDGFVDCADSDCQRAPECIDLSPEICDNGLDDDADGAVDCLDEACKDSGACSGNAEDCTNQRDDDGDGRSDCLDPECFNHPSCDAPPELCANGADDDRDGAIDCDDDECASDPSCVADGEICTNQRDDDRDGFVDCADPDCFNHPDCRIRPGVERCNNGLDDDQDGAIDCADSECASLPICVSAGREICDNGLDDDQDGARDCADPECRSHPACVDQVCRPEIDFGTLAAIGASATRIVDSLGTGDRFPTPCVVQGGGEVVTRFRLSSRSDLNIAYVQRSGDQVLSLYRAGIGETCNANPLRCLDPRSEPEGMFSLSALDPGDYYLFVESFAAGLEGSVELTLSTGSGQTPEACNNGIDDDGDGLTDCEDLQCAGEDHCTSRRCAFDVDLGALIVDGSARDVVVDTSGADNAVEARCAAGGGGERVVRFVMPTAGGIAVDVAQRGWHVFGLHRDAGPGTRCTSDRGSCFDSNATSRLTLSFENVERGVYYFVIDALDATREGSVELSIAAFANRGSELCGNDIDDDGDGLTDCLDPECIAHPLCGMPICVPDLSAGVLRVGGPAASFRFDTRSLDDSQGAPCALGGGRDAVVSLTLADVAGLRVSCNDGGDHIVGLYRAERPRDPCDAAPISCADPTTGPIGCSFVFPNLQPGQYYVITEAYRAGGEGEFDLSLEAVRDHAQEICTNGVDDDNDGDIDCADLNCAGNPVCEDAACTVEQAIGILNRGGPRATVALSTEGADDSAASRCAANGQGAGDAVISLTLVQESSLTIRFAQLGNHVFSLYPSRGVDAGCAAAPPLDCVSSQGQGLGAASFAKVPPGEYFLVVDSENTGAQGSIGLEISAE